MVDGEGVLASDAAAQYRLPDTVVPERYELRLAPDLETSSFEGEERVSVKVLRPVSEVVLNALELELLSASAEREGRSLSASVSLEPASERSRLRFETELEPGDWLLRIAFRGTLNDKLHGFYRSHYRDAQGATHTVACTQFEATDARRAFPCWDEPALKARFKTTLVIDERLIAISNTAIESERALDNGRKEVVFRETIPMSTYLVAFVVGEFAATAPSDAGVPLRVIHVPGKEALTGWAREVGSFSIRFFTDYYGLPYPGDKLDLIAIPDFASGAMENLGAITFRESALLVDPKSASRSELERVADVVCHENAHMWFGDLVTMKWWNGIWLNEAFATFMEMLAVDAWRPQWRRWESFSGSRAAAMTIDALMSTRPIEYPVHSPEDARGMFDVLTYEKGASVLRMLEQYLGAEVFRRGISAYLRQHAYANAETTDLWDALEEGSHEPVRRLMDSWIFQPGLPLVEVALAPGRGMLKLSQRRFLYLGEQAGRKDGQRWHIPVTVRIAGNKGTTTRKLILSEHEATVELPADFRYALVNDGGHGFYRVNYAAELLDALLGNLGDLSAVERFGLINDRWALTVAGFGTVAKFLETARRFRGETELNVWRPLVAALGYLDLIVGDGDRPALAAAVRDIAGDAAARLGWTPKPGEDELTRQLRGLLWSALGTLGDDPAVQSEAKSLYGRYLADSAAVDRDVVPALVSILAACGDEARFGEFRARFQRARTPQEEQRYLFALAGFRRPELLRRTMEMTLGNEVRTQNAPYLLESLLMNPACRYEAWEFMRRNWEAICERFPDAALPRMCEGIIVLLDREAEVRDFFSVHKVRIGERLIEQHIERLRIAVSLREREGKALAAALAARA